MVAWSESLFAKYQFKYYWLHCRFEVHKIINIKSLHSKDCLEQNSSDKSKWSPWLRHCMSPFHELGACKIGTSNPFKRSNSPACRASPWKAPRQAQNSCWIGHQRYLHRSEFFMCKLCFQFATADMLQCKIASKEPLPNLNAQMLHAKLLDQKQRCDKQTLDPNTEETQCMKDMPKTASTLTRAWFPSPGPELELQPWMANETC